MQLSGRGALQNQYFLTERCPSGGSLFYLRGGFGPIAEELPDRLFLPPVQKLVATLISGDGKNANPALPPQPDKNSHHKMAVFGFITRKNQEEIMIFCRIYTCNLQTEVLCYKMYLGRFALMTI